MLNCTGLWGVGDAQAATGNVFKFSDPNAELTDSRDNVLRNLVEENLFIDPSPCLNIPYTEKARLLSVVRLKGLDGIKGILSNVYAHIRGCLRSATTSTNLPTVEMSSLSYSTYASSYVAEQAAYKRCVIANPGLVLVFQLGGLLLILHHLSSL